MIATNARVAQNQDEYSTAYDAAVGRYESTKAERDSYKAKAEKYEAILTENDLMPEE